MNDSTSLSRRQWLMAGLAASGALSVGAAACTTTNSNNQSAAISAAAVIDALAFEVIAPGYAKAKPAAEAFSTQLKTYAAGPSDASVSALAQAWRELRKEIKRMECVELGPAITDGYRDKIDWNPAKTDKINSILASAAPVDAAVVASAGTSSKGMMGLEYALFSPDLGAERLKAGSQTALYIGYAGQALVADTIALANAWGKDGQDYVSQFANSGQSGGAYGSAQEALNALVEGMVRMTETMQVTKVAKPSGIKGGVPPQPQLLEARLSHNSLDDLRNNMDGLHELYRGGVEVNPLGLAALVQSRDAALSGRIEQAFANCKERLAGINVTLEELVMKQPSEAQSLYDVLRVLKKAFFDELVPTVGLSLGFHDNDGD